jgi:heme-degrading monooxygenase HmoA
MAIPSRSSLERKQPGSKKSPEKEGAPMIVRIWRGVTPEEKADQYLAYLMETGVKDYAAVAGNQGVQVLRRMYEGKAEFLILSFWDSYEAIRAFAGDDMEKAVYYDKDKEFLLELEPNVTHYELATKV